MTTTLADPDDNARFSAAADTIVKAAEEYDTRRAKSHEALSRLADSLQSTIRWHFFMLGYTGGIATLLAVAIFVK